MIVNNLKSNIREFITVFGGVTQEQIHLMFREHNPSTINYHLQGLILNTMSFWTKKIGIS